MELHPATRRRAKWSAIWLALSLGFASTIAGVTLATRALARDGAAIPFDVSAEPAIKVEDRWPAERWPAGLCNSEYI